MASGGRLDALDVLRGAAVAGMFLVTMQGDWAHVYPPLRHADWNGWTAADIVFPAFLFATGVTLGLQFTRATADAAGRARFWRRLGRRSLLLVAVGLLLEATYNLAISAGAQFPGQGGLEHLRLPGVLQRIGLCNGAAGALAFVTAAREADGARRIRPAALAFAAGAILLAYAALLLFVPVPGFGAARFDAVGSWPAYLDRLVFTPAHLWPLATAVPGGPVVYDPEGLLSTFPAVVDVVAGVLAGDGWRRGAGRDRPFSLEAATTGAGLLLVAAGLALDPVLPINKRLWTPSFALLSSGASALLFASAAVLCRWPPARPLLGPLRVLGANAILAFVIATLFSRLSGFAWVREGGASVTPQVAGDHLIQRLLPDPNLASLACAVGITGLITLALWPLHRRGFHLRL